MWCRWSVDVFHNPDFQLSPPSSRAYNVLGAQGLVDPVSHGVGEGLSHNAAADEVIGDVMTHEGSWQEPSSAAPPKHTQPWHGPDGHLGRGLGLTGGAIWWPGSP